MSNRFINVFISAILTIGLCVCMFVPVSANAATAANANAVVSGNRVTDSSTGYSGIVMDYANIFTETEEKLLLNDMSSLLRQCNVAVCSVDENPYGDADYYAARINEELFGGYYENSVTVFIDMDTRYVIIDTTGDIADIITANISDTITDNCYGYLSQKLYYSGVQRMLEQIGNKLKGMRIAQPIKYISNAFIAIIVGLAFTYVIARKKFLIVMKAGNASVYRINWNGRGFDYNEKDKYDWNPEITYERTKTTYSPVKSASSSSGGSRSGGHFSGGGGGGHSGGGHSSGGHRF